MSRFDEIDENGNNIRKSNFNIKENTSIQEDLKQVFRTGELARRQERMQILQNYLNLEKEHLTPAEIEMDKKLSISKVKQELTMYNKVGYFKTLWLAIKGKL